MILPVLIAAAIILGFVVHTRIMRSKGAGAGLLAALPYLLLLSFLVFPMVSSTAFRAFSCEAFDDGRAFLRADYGVECSIGTHTSDAHENAKRLAYLGIFIYPVGVSLLYAALMLRARRAILQARPTALSSALGFLCRGYAPRYFCLLYTSPSPRDGLLSRMPSSA